MNRDVAASDDGIGRVWSGLLSVAGAVAGLGALVYIVGAATLWVRFDAAGLPADAAIAHEPYSLVIAVGLRGLIGVGFVVLAATFLFFYVCVYFGAVFLGRRDQLARGKRLIDLLAEGAKGLDGSSARQFGVWAAIAIFIASLTTWRWLGLVLFLAATTGATLLYAHRRSSGLRGVPLWLVVSYVLAAAALGAAWQISSLEPVQGVIVTPQLPNPTLPSNLSVPYFGEDSDHVFLGDVVLKAGSTSSSPHPWTFCYRVVELDRTKITSLSFVGNSKLGSNLKRPLVGLIALLMGRGLADHPTEDPACSKT